MTTPAPGDRYRFLRVLGGGGMAKVYLAFDGVLEREVAVKLLHEQFAKDEEFVERFRREARSAASLHHKNIVPVYDLGRFADGSHFMAMEYVNGGTLQDRIRRGPLDAAEAARISLKVAEALGEAHRRGIVHRDIKPQNILMSGLGEPRVADFGIARAASTATLTRASLVFGTAGYMSPEQALGEPVGPPSDLYSLGVVLYEMLSGVLPHDAETPVAVAIKHVNQTPRRPGELVPNIPQDLEGLTMRLLEKGPEDRFSDGDALAAELRRTLAGKGDRPTTTAATAPVRRDPARTPQGLRPPASGTAPHARKRRRTGRLLTFCLAGTLLLGGGTFAAGKLDLHRDVKRSGPAAATLRAEVPNVVGLAPERAKVWLAKAGFEAKTARRASSQDQAGKVLAQSLSGGARARKGAGVLLAVGSGPRKVATPDLAYLSKAAATLEKAGLKLGRVTKVPSESVNEGSVVSQRPAAGTEVRPESAVNVVVSTGPAATGAKSAPQQTVTAQRAVIPQSAPPQSAPPQSAQQQTVLRQTVQQQTVRQQSVVWQSAPPPGGTFSGAPPGETSSQETSSQVPAQAQEVPAQTTSPARPSTAAGAPGSGTPGSRAGRLVGGALREAGLR